MNSGLAISSGCRIHICLFCALFTKVNAVAYKSKSTVFESRGFEFEFWKKYDSNIKRLKKFLKSFFTATERHPPYGITQCYLPPDYIAICTLCWPKYA